MTSIPSARVRRHVWPQTTAEVKPAITYSTSVKQDSFYPVPNALFGQNVVIKYTAKEYGVRDARHGGKPDTKVVSWTNEHKNLSDCWSSLLTPTLASKETLQRVRFRPHYFNNYNLPWIRHTDLSPTLKPGKLE